MRYKLHCIKQEKEFFIGQIQELKTMVLSIRALGRYKDTEEKAKRLIYYYKKRLRTVEKEIENFENHIESIPDEEVKKMAKSYFIDLKSCDEIGNSHYLCRTAVFYKLKKYFKI